jgi:hypothetical protein
MQRPTVWMAIAGVCAVVAIGLGIWGLSTKSDLDDANATIEQRDAQLAQEQSQLSGEERSAAATEAKEQAFGQQARQRYQAVRGRFVSEQKRADQLRSDITRESQQLTAARDAAADAQGQDEQLRARLKQAREQHDLAGACARGSLSAIDEFFDADDAKSGADKAISRLEDLQDECQAAVGEES